MPSLFALVLGDRPEAYAAFADEYYATAIKMDAVRAIYAMQPLTSELAARLYPDSDPTGLRGQVEAIGYPVASPFRGQQHGSAATCSVHVRLAEVRLTAA